ISHLISRLKQAIGRRQCRFNPHPAATTGRADSSTGRRRSGPVTWRTSKRPRKPWAYGGRPANIIDCCSGTLRDPRRGTGKAWRERESFLLAGGASAPPAKSHLESLTQRALTLVPTDMATSIPHLVPLEVSGVDPLLRHGLLATGRHGSGIAVVWVEGVVDVAVKVGGAMKPRAGNDEHAPGEPFRAVVAGR